MPEAGGVASWERPVLLYNPAARAYLCVGKDDTADDLARHSSWDRHALRFYNGEVADDERPQAVRRAHAARW